MSALRNLCLAAVLIASSSAHAAETVVHIDNFTFNPAEITVKPGTKVVWENGDDIPHVVVEDNAKFRSPALDSGEKFSLAFTEPGEINYFCALHPHMKGKVVVKP